MTGLRYYNNTNRNAKHQPYLWFNTEAEEAAKLYASVFKNGASLASIALVIRS